MTLHKIARSSREACRPPSVDCMWPCFPQSNTPEDDDDRRCVGNPTSCSARTCAAGAWAGLGQLRRSSSSSSDEETPHLSFSTLPVALGPGLTVVLYIMLFASPPDNEPTNLESGNDRVACSAEDATNPLQHPRMISDDRRRQRRRRCPRCRSRSLPTCNG